MIVDLITLLFLFVGLIFSLGTVIGLIRFPDLFTRIHAASKGDTLTSFLMLTAFALYNLHDFSSYNLLVSVKIMFITLFIFITSPTAGNALIEAAYKTGAKPWRKGEKPWYDGDLSDSATTEEEDE